MINFIHEGQTHTNTPCFFSLLLVKSSLELTEEGHSLPLVDASQAKLSAPLLLNGVSLCRHQYYASASHAML